MRIWRRFPASSVAVFSAAALVLAVLYLGFRILDPVPPSRLVLVAGAAGSRYDEFARKYAQVFARQGVTLEIRHAAGALEGLAQLRDANTGVQAALTAFGFTEPGDGEALASLGGVYDAPLFVFYRGDESMTRFDQLRGKRVSIGMPGTALRPLVRSVLQETQALDASTQLVDMEPAASLDALIAGSLDAAFLPASLGSALLQRALDAPGIRMMNVAQAEAIAKAVPGLRHVVLWRGLISLGRDVPSENVDLPRMRPCRCSHTFAREWSAHTKSNVIYRIRPTRYQRPSPPARPPRPASGGRRGNERGKEVFQGGYLQGDVDYIHRDRPCQRLMQWAFQCLKNPLRRVKRAS